MDDNTADIVRRLIGAVVLIAGLWGVTHNVEHAGWLIFFGVLTAL